MLNRLKALTLLSECTGEEIWSVAYCEQSGVPAPWIEELTDCFESGFRFDRDTIYENNQVVNQYEGIHDLRLAYKLAEYIGVNIARATASALGRRAEVQALKEAVDE